MRCSNFTILAGYAAIALADKKRANSSLQKRTLKSCEDTYGPGSVQCGNKNSTYCYSPSLGQSCCPADDGYCEKGAFCAPVAGFCCLDDEDIATCAQKAGFSIPVPSNVHSGAISEVNRSRSSTSADLVQSLVSPILILPASSTPSKPAESSANPFFQAPEGQNVLGEAATTTTSTTTHVAAETDAGDALGNGPIVPFSVGSPNPVQVSVAKKEQWRLVFMGVAIGVVGVFMSSC